MLKDRDAGRAGNSRRGRKQQARLRLSNRDCMDVAIELHQFTAVLLHFTITFSNRLLHTK